MSEIYQNLKLAASDIEAALPFLDGSVPNLLIVVKKGLLGAATEIERLRAELRESENQRAEGILRNAELKNQNASITQDLNDARDGWEAATEEVRQLEQVLIQLRQENEAGMQATLRLREECGANDNECFPDFVRRLHAELQQAREQRIYFEGAWNRAVDAGTEFKQRADSSERRVKELESTIETQRLALIEIAQAPATGSLPSVNMGPLVTKEFWKPRIIARETLANLPRSTQDLMRLVEAVERHHDERESLFQRGHLGKCVCNICEAYRAFKGERNG